MRFHQTADWFKRPIAPREDALSSFETTKLFTFPEGTGTHEAVEETIEEDDRLELAEDAELTMQLRAVKSGRRAVLAAIAVALVALGSGIGLVL